MGSIRRPFGHVGSLGPNVVDLSAFRKKMQREPSAPIRIPVFYLTEQKQCEEALGSFPLLDVISITCPEQLSTVATTKPAIVLVESFLSWGCPVELVDHFTKAGCSVLMVYRPEERAKNQKLLKRAFQVGLFDTVTSPVSREELRERLSIVFRLNRQTISW